VRVDRDGSEDGLTVRAGEAVTAPPATDQPV